MHNTQGVRDTGGERRKESAFGGGAIGGHVADGSSKEKHDEKIEVASIFVVLVREVVGAKEVTQRIESK